MSSLIFFSGGACSKYFSIDTDSGKVSVEHPFDTTSEGIQNNLCILTVQVKLADVKLTIKYVMPFRF
jgi:hypothetical protein